MSDINTITITGRIGQAPEIRATQKGTKVANLSIACQDYRGGEKVTDWFRVAVFGHDAGYVEQHIGKGASVAITGRLQTKSWTDQDGREQRAVEILANQIVKMRDAQ